MGWARANLMYDGVETHGQLHRLRMTDVFFRRSSILFQAVATIATSMIRQENQEAVLRQMRRLNELMFPEDPKRREEQERSLRETLQREGSKSYKVRRLNLGERGD